MSNNGHYNIFGPRGERLVTKKQYIQRVKVKKSFLADTYPNQPLDSQLEAFGRKLYGSQFVGGQVLDETATDYVIEIGFWAVTT